MGTFRDRKDKKGRNRYQYIIELHRNGRKIYKSKTFNTKREALQWEKKFLYEVDNGIITKESLKKRKVADAIEKYITTILPQRPKNARNILQHLGWWGKQIGNCQLSEATPAVCADCRDRLTNEVGPKGKIRKSGTVLRYISTMSSVFECCVKDWMWISQNPMRAIRKPSPGNRKARFFTLEEIFKLLDICKASNSTLILPIFILAIHTGMRRGEILSLRWENINFQEKIIHLPNSKNGEPRNIAMTEAVFEALSKLENQNNERNGLVFPSPNNLQKPIDIKSTWERILTKAGITDGTFHTTRHSFCSFSSALGVTPPVLARMTGHKDSRTTDIYIDVVESHCRDVMKQLEALIPLREQ